jgi:hypothetical protein
MRVSNQPASSTVPPSDLIGGPAANSAAVQPDTRVKPEGCSAFCYGPRGSTEGIGE